MSPSSCALSTNVYDCGTNGRFMVLKWDQRRAYAAIPFVPAHSSIVWISLSSGVLDRLCACRADDKSFKSHYVYPCMPFIVSLFLRSFGLRPGRRFWMSIQSRPQIDTVGANLAVNCLNHCSISSTKSLQKSSSILAEACDLVCSNGIGHIKNKRWSFLALTYLLK